MMEGVRQHGPQGVLGANNTWPSDQPTPQLGPYLLMGELGRGGMGVVFRAQHAVEQRWVAIKTVRVDHAGQIASLRREIHALQHIKHPAVVRILDQGIHRGRPWYAMELLEGATLRGLRDEVRAELGGVGALDEGAPRVDADADTLTMLLRSTLEPGLQVLLETQGGSVAPLPKVIRAHAQGRKPQPQRLHESLRILRRLCVGLGHVHNKGVVHQDLKPDNVFVRSNGQPVLVDFGLVSRFGGAGREVLDAAQAPGGTPAYMAPEQITGQAVDARADLYAIGCILYELCSGRFPFAAPDVAQLLYQHLYAHPQPLSEVVEGIEPGLERLAMRLLSKRRQERLGYADDVLRVLEALGVGPEEGEEAAPPSYLYLPQLVGRREARDGLLRRLALTISGRGGCAVLGGESGVGKTFLAKALVAVVRSKMQVVVGECVPVGAQARGQAIHSSPLHPLRPLLQAINDLCVEGGAQATERLLGERAKILADYEPSLRQLPGVAEMPEPAEVSAEAARRRLLGALTETLAALSEERPLLLVLDDVQWADGLTLDFLASLPPSFCEERPLFLLATYRSEEVTPALGAWLKQPWVEDVRLGRLQRQSLGEMVSEMLAVEDPPDPLIDFLDQRSKGNPFFVAEYLRAAVTQGLLSRHEGEWLVHEGQEYGTLALPDALHGLILLRLGGLNEQTRALLEALAVLGREVELVVVERLTGGRGLDALGELFERQILEQQREFRWRVKFAHDKLREHTYEAIQPARRAPLHREAALLLEACYGQQEPELALRYAELAFHWQQAGEPGQAVHYFEKAGEQALRHSAHADAVALLSEALELHRRLGHADPLRLARIERQMGDAYMGMQLHKEATARLYGAVAALGWPIPSPGAGMVGAFVREIAWQALQRARGVDALQSAADPRFAEGAKAYVRLQAGARAKGEAAMILYTALKALNLAERGGDIAGLAEGYALASVILGSVPLGTQRWAARYGEMSLEALQRTDDPKARCAVFTFRGLDATFAGRVEAGRDLFLEACRVAKLRGDLRGYEDALSALAVNMMILGDVRGFWSAGQELLDSVQRGVPRYQCWGLLFCVDAAVRLERFDEAERLLQQEAQIPNLERALLERFTRCTAQALLDARRARWDAVVEGLDRRAADIDTIKPMILEFIYLMPRLLDLLGLVLAALPSSDPRRPRLLARYRWTVRWLQTSGRTYKVASVYAKVYEGLEAAFLRKPSAPKLLLVGLEQAEACQMRYVASVACLALAQLLPHQADPYTARARALLAHASPQDPVPLWPLAL